MTEAEYQFTHTTKRRPSVFDAQGKPGLYLPSDFIKTAVSPSGQTLENEEYINHDETSPLIPKHVSRSSVSHEIISQERDILHANHIPLVDSDDDDQIARAFASSVSHHRISTTTWSEELKVLIRLSIPTVSTFLLEMSFSTVSVFAVGHIGAIELAAVTMGSMTANITAYAIIQGMATALDTLCPQAFGARKYHLVGEYFQQGLALIMCVMLPVLFCWVFFGYEIIARVVPDHKTAELAAVYLRYVAFGVPAYIMFECGKRFLQAQEIYDVAAYVLCVAAPTNLVMNLGLVRAIGYIGAPIAVAINYWLMTLMLFIATVYFIKPESTPQGFHPLQCWDGWNTKNAFSGWKKLLELAIPGLIMLEAEFLAFEILTLLASHISTIALAAQSIATTIAALTYQVPFAIGIASSTRIANYLGAGLGQSAKVATQVSLCLGVAASLINLFVLVIFKTQIANAFTNDKEVVNTLLGIVGLIATMQIADALNANSAGCLRGQGQTKIGGIVNLVSYYFVGLPLSVYITFYSPWKGSLDGLWIGAIAALALIGVVQSYYALAANFESLCEQARKRTNGSSV